MGIYFLATDIVIVIMFIMTGLLTRDLFLVSLHYTPAVLAGFIAGSYFFKDITKQTYLMGVHFLLFVAAVMLCV